MILKMGPYLDCLCLLSYYAGVHNTTYELLTTLLHLRHKNAGKNCEYWPSPALTKFVVQQGLKLV
jgi:hypothetical protein